MNTPRRSNIKSVTVPFKKLPSAVQTQLLQAESRSAELINTINELAGTRRPHDLRVAALEKEIIETRKALDAAMMLLNYYRDPVR